MHLKGKFFVLALALLTQSTLALAATKVPLLKLSQGVIQGYESGDTHAFKGIPYAQPPVGSLRWKAPAAPLNWTGTLDAKDFSSSCIQTENFNPEAKVTGQEDCLTLNIWKPSPPSSNRPVMVFFHGGSFSYGSSSGEMAGLTLYDGTQLSSRGNVIVVTVNYRLGALGFFAHPELTKTPGNDNLGLRDQLAALKWVKQNIAKFGGDPARVTIFGESAGAFSVGGLLVSPLGKGLFSKALMQSGSMITDTREKAEEVALRFEEITGCTAGRNADCLRNLSTAQIMKAMAVIMKNQGERIIFGPYVDGAVLPESPAKLLREGNFNHVPLLIGSNTDEMTTLLIPELMRNPVVTEDEYVKILKQDYGEDVAARIQEKFPVKNNGTPIKNLKMLYGDAIFHCPAQQFANAVSDQNLPVYRYVFNHTHHNDPLRVIGAGHALELPYVFHNFPYLTTNAPDIFELGLSNEMIKYWTNFAETGNPNSAYDKSKWPKYNGHSEKYLELDIISRAKAHFREDACEFWNEVAI